MKIAIYFSYFYKIGGIESAIYYFCKRYYKKYDITIYYRENKEDDYQIQRLSKLVKCVKYDKQNIITDLLLVTGWDLTYLNYIFEHTKASKKVFWNHGNAEYINRFAFAKPYDEIVTVSDNTRKAWLYYKVNPKVLYTPVDIEKINNKNKDSKIRLITTSRMSHEKGAERMIKLINALNEDKVNFEWDIYSDHNEKFTNLKNVNLKEPSLNVLPAISEADCLVQLSDDETFGITPYEAMQLDTSVVVTEFRTFKEMKPVDGSYCILKFDCSNLNDAVKFIKNCKNIKAFDYKGIYTEWDRYLYRLQNKINKKENKLKIYLVKGKLEYKIKDIDYIVITDTIQDSNINYIKIDNFDNITKNGILELVKDYMY